jgi:aerobic-type carbon monoxide dehydrogenase small subunit (CoxS/CutS family)
MAEVISFKVNGERRSITAEPNMPLLYAPRNDLALDNPHFGCGLGQCGACTVHVNGEAALSCVLPVSAARNAEIVTLEGLGTPEKPHPVQEAFIEEQATQCGYCLSGWIMTSAALLEKKPKASEAEIRQALSRLQCRCGAHMSMLRAVKRAGEKMGGGGAR